jgi:hypothetical protein
MDTYPVKSTSSQYASRDGQGADSGNEEPLPRESLTCILRTAILDRHMTQVVALVGAVAWPLTAIVVVVLARKQISDLVHALGGRLSRLSVAGVGIEFAKLEAVDTTSDLLAAIRQPIEANQFTARAGAPSPSLIGNLKDLIREGSRTDYAIIDFGEGKRWLTSRLYIFAAMLRWALGVEELVFTETAGGVRGRFVCKASTGATCRRLSTRYRWLGEAFAAAAATAPFLPPTPGQAWQMLPGDPSDVQAVQLIEQFLRNVQQLAAPPGQEAEWVALEVAAGQPPLFEHARWLNGGDVERLLREDLTRERIQVSLGSSTEQQARQAVAAHGHYVAVVDPEGRFDSLLDRHKVTEAVARASLPAAPGQ